MWAHNAMARGKWVGPFDSQGFTLVVYHKSWLTSEPSLLLDGAMDDSSESHP